MLSWVFDKKQNTDGDAANRQEGTSAATTADLTSPRPSGPTSPRRRSLDGSALAPGLGLDGVTPGTSRASSPSMSARNYGKETRRNQSELQLQKSKEEHGKMKDRQMAMLDHIHGISSSLATLKQENTDLRESEQKLQHSHFQLQQQVQKYQNGELSAGLSEKEKTELRDLRESESRLQQRLKLANSELQQQVQQVENSEKRVAALRTENAEHRESVLKWQGANSKLQQQILDLQKREQSLLALKPENAELREREQKLQAANAAFQQQVSQLQASLQRAKDDLQRKVEEAHDRERSLAAFKLENADLRESEQKLLASSIEQQHLMQKRDSAEQRLRVAHDELQAKFQAFTKDTDSKIKTLTESEQRLKKSNDDLKGRSKMSNKELNDRIQQLQTANEEMEMQLKALTEDLDVKSERLQQLELNEVLLKQMNADAHQKLELYEEKARDCTGTNCNQQ